MAFNNHLMAAVEMDRKRREARELPKRVARLERELRHQKIEARMEELRKRGY